MSLVDFIKNSQIYDPGNPVEGSKLQYSSEALSGTEIDFSGSSDFFTKTIAENTTFTIISPKLGRVICLVVDGDYTITMPATVTDVGDLEYDGTVTNYVYIQCVDASTPKYIMTVVR